MEQIPSTPRQAEYALAFRSIRASKNLCAVCIFLCIFLQIGGLIAVHFARVLDEPTVAVSTETQPARDAAEDAAEATTQPAEPDVYFASICRTVLSYGLAGSRFAAMILCLMLMLMVMFAVKLSLVERVGGVAGFMSAFNWSLVLLVMLIPWRPILGGSLSCGALFNLGELLQADASLGDTPDHIRQMLFYARFIAYPCVAMFTCLLVQAKFAKGYAAADFNPGQADAISARLNPPSEPTE